jgi:serine/threonine protein kinase
MNDTYRVAPEVLMGCAYSYAVDMWAVGIITYIMYAKVLVCEQYDSSESC